MISQLGMNGDLGDMDSDSVQNNYNLAPYSASSTNLSPPSLIAYLDVPDTSTGPPLLPDSPDLVYSSPTQPRKARKEKLRIGLAPDQPPTTQGRPRARVFVACVQWCAPYSMSMPSSTLELSLAVGARSVVTVRSRCATTALSVTVPSSVPTTLCRSGVAPIGSREHELVARSQTKTESQGVGDAVPRQSSKQPVVGLMASGGQASAPSPRHLIPWQIRLSLPIHSKASLLPIQ